MENAISQTMVKILHKFTWVRAAFLSLSFFLSFFLCVTFFLHLGENSRPSTSSVRVSYFEGDYSDNFASSYFQFTVVDDVLIVTDTHVYVVDRLHEFRKTCSTNSTWITSVAPVGLQSGQSGFVEVSDPISASGELTECFPFDSSITFKNPLNQFMTDINVSFHLPLVITPNTLITVYLPGFTNNNINLPMNPTKKVSTMITGNPNPSWIGNGDDQVFFSSFCLFVYNSVSFFRLSS
jgi:hypothetical protein